MNTHLKKNIHVLNLRISPDILLADMSSMPRHSQHIVWHEKDDS